MSSHPAIQTDSLRKVYGDTVAVADLTLSVQSGSVFGFLGPNGAGKTTTMRMLTCLLRPTSGSAWVTGAPIEDREAVTGRIGYLPEEPPIYDELTGREQLEYWAGLRDMERQTSRERIESLLTRLDLRSDADRRIAAYSTGMRQKLGIAQTVLHEPDVLFLDEPTSGLDPGSVRTVREIITEFAENGATVFLSTHVLSVVDELAERVGVLHDGGLVAQAPPEELKSRVSSSTESTLEEAFIQITTEQPRTTA